MLLVVIGCIQAGTGVEQCNAIKQHKQAAHQTIDHIEHLTWAKLNAVKASIEHVLEEANSGQFTSQDEIEEGYGIS